MKKSTRFSPEVMERALRMVEEAGSQYESQWAAITSIAGKIGCNAETLRRWVRQHERDQQFDAYRLRPRCARAGALRPPA